MAGVELTTLVLSLPLRILYGGLKAVALTDIIQVVFLILGGLLIAWILLNEVSAAKA